MPDGNNNTGTVIVSVTVMFCFSLAVIGALAWAIPDGERVGTMATIILGSLAPTIAAITILVRQDKVKEVAQETNDTVNELRNGAMEANIRSIVKGVLDARDREWQTALDEGRDVSKRPGI